MDAPPEREDSRPFVRVAQLMHGAGLRADRSRTSDFERGFLLLSDLGVTTYASGARCRQCGRAFSDAIDALILWQRASTPAALPPYDEAMLRRELDLFPEWYLQRHLGVTPDAGQKRALGSTFARS